MPWRFGLGRTCDAVEALHAIMVSVSEGASAPPIPISRDWITRGKCGHKSIAREDHAYGLPVLTLPVGQEATTLQRF